MIDIQLRGFAELAAKLRDMPDNISRNALRSAVAAGAAVVRDEAKARIGTDPKIDTGTLKRSLYIKQIRELSGLTRQTFYVGARQGKRYAKMGKKGRSADAYYAKWVELGHFTRAVKSSNRGQRNNAALEAAVRSGKVKWVPGHPFLRPAFELKRGAAIDSIAAKLRERLERYRVQGK